MKQFLLFISAIFFSLNLVSQVTVINQTNPTCPGMCNGAVTLSITGGTAPYAISTPGGPSSCTITTMTNVTSNTITISNLCACFYNFVVTDALLNVVGIAPVTIVGPAPIQITFNVKNVCCNGACNGSISAIPFGGTAPYSYTWFPTGGNTPTLTGACAGSYDLCVMDANSCAQCATTQVTQPAVFSLSSTVTAATCGTCCNGGITVSGSGGQPPYSYTVFPGSMTNSSGTFSNVCSGSYSVCGSDNGCCTTCIGVTVPISSSVKNLAAKGDDIFIYPNPSRGTLYLRSQTDLTGATYEVHDILGRKLESGDAEEFSKMSPLKDGVYFITIRNKQCVVINRTKIIIEK